MLSSLSGLYAWAHALSAVPPMPTFCFGDRSRHQSIHPAFQRYANKLIPSSFHFTYGTARP